MNLGRVIGTVVATQKYEGLTGCKLLLVQPLDHALRKAGDYLVAVDTVRAGFDELIYFVNSREAALALEPSFVPVDAAIVGIVDDVAADALPAIDAEIFFHAGRAAHPALGAAAKTGAATAEPPANAEAKAAAKDAPAHDRADATAQDTRTKEVPAQATATATTARDAATSDTAAKDTAAKDTAAKDTTAKDAARQAAPSAPAKVAPTKKSAAKGSRRRP